MKKVMMAMAAALVLLACEKEESLIARVKQPEDSLAAKTITFIFGGGISQQPMTRATLGDVNITDVWLFDYVDGTLLQTIHQSSTDEGFGSVAVTADNGQHAFCFVASRGTGATVSNGAITWEKPSDTFWQKVTMEVTPQTSTSQTVELQRVATRLRISVTDEVPASLSKLTIVADTWYCGLNALTGSPTTATERTTTITVPASYAGTFGQLTASVFGLCGDDYTTDVTVTAIDANSQQIASVTLDDVTMKRNTTTTFSGPLFSRQPTFALTVDDGWGDDIVDTW